MQWHHRSAVVKIAIRITERAKGAGVMGHGREFIQVLVTTKTK